MRTSWWISQKESTEPSNEKEMMNEEVGSEVVFVPGCMLCQCFSGAHPLLTLAPILPRFELQIIVTSCRFMRCKN